MIVAIVPARGGSRGLSRKNLRRIGGRSLVELAVAVARAAPSVDRVIVSTDDEAIAREAERVGAEVPFRRPASLATDDAATVDVLRHACAELETAGETIDVVVTLQPTSPLRTADVVEAAIAPVRDGEADSAVTVEELGLPWSTLGFLDGATFRRPPQPDDQRRQASPEAARITGAVYVTRRELLDQGLVIGPRCAAVVTRGGSTIDIDSFADLRRARRAKSASRS